MTDNNIENKLRAAVEHATPDRLDSILAHCAPQSESNVVELPVRSQRRWIRAAAGMAAALALVVCGSLGYNGYHAAHDVRAVIGLDVNPSLEIEINARGEVVGASAVNEDGEDILASLELDGVELETAVDEIVAKLVENDYISALKNSVLVSVRGEDAAESDALRQQVVDMIASALAEYDIDGAILSMSSEGENEAAAEAAAQLDISESKAALVLSASAALPNASETDLSGLTISELNVLLTENGVTLDGVNSTGQASAGAYIGSDKAGAEVTAHAGITDSGAEAGVTLGCKYGKLVYDVSFSFGNFDYSYYVDAANGRIMTWLASASDALSDSDGSGITLDEAREIVFEHAGISADAASRLAISFVNDEYEIQFNADGVEYEYDVNGFTGDIIKWAAASLESIFTHSGGGWSGATGDDFESFFESYEELEDLFEWIEDIG